MWRPTKWLGVAWLMATAVLIACLFLMIRQSRAQAGVLCVVPPGESTGPFPACDQVFTAVQDAVDTAVGGEEIWVATGVYTDVHNHAGYNQIAYLDKNVILQGGYQIPFADLPDPAANPTILDANGLGRGVLVAEDTAVTLVGFHITGGDATGINLPDGIGIGGGLYASNADVTLRESAIYSNTASRLNDGMGGGLAFAGGTITLTENIIYQNVASQSGGFGGGGGISVLDSLFTIENNQIISNTALITGTTLNSSVKIGAGGGLGLADSFGVLRGNSIAANLAAEYGDYGEGGGVFARFAPTAVPRDIIISDNIVRKNIGLIQGGTGEGIGGGIFAYQYDGFSEPQPFPPSVAMMHNDVSENVAGLNIGGTVGGIFIGNETKMPYTVTLNHNAIISNAASWRGRQGFAGGLALSGVTATLRHNAVLSNTTVFSGTIGGGGGLYIINSQVSQQADIVQGNVAEGGATGSGGGLVVEESEAIMENVAIIDNSAQDDGAAILLLASDLTLLQPTIARNNGAEAIYVSESPAFIGALRPAVLTMTNGILSEQSVGIFVTGSHTVSVQGILWHNVPLTISGSVTPNISISDEFVGDPLFAPDGYHIQENSDAIGRGVPSGVMFDIDDEGRPLLNPALGVDEFWPFKFYFSVVRR